MLIIKQLCLLLFSCVFFSRFPLAVYILSCLSTSLNHSHCMCLSPVTLAGFVMSFKVIFATEILEMSLKRSALKCITQSKQRCADYFPLDSSRCAFLKSCSRLPSKLRSRSAVQFRSTMAYDSNPHQLYFF